MFHFSHLTVALIFVNEIITDIIVTPIIIIIIIIIRIALFLYFVCVCFHSFALLVPSL
jgi:hypothetical protein